MKTILIISIILQALIGYSQESFLKFKEEKLLINGVNTVVASTMLKGDFNDVKKSWRKFVKTHLQQKMDEKDNVQIVKETVINQVSDKRGDLISYIYKTGNELSFNIAFKLGYDVYLNSDKFPEEFKKFNDFLEYFTYNYYNDYLPAYIKGLNKNLRDLEKEVKTAKKSIKKSTRSNKQNDRKISKNEKKISKLESKAELDTKETLRLNEAKQQIVQYQKQLEYNSGLVKVSEGILVALDPKVSELQKEINSANLSLIEVRSKIELYK